MPYAYVKQRGAADEMMSIDSARKYSSFSSHEDWWQYIMDLQRDGRPQLFNEVLRRAAPRCLYFDLDGEPCHKGNHSFHVELLQQFLRRFFLGDSLGWQAWDPEPVVLQSHQEEKYSCHVMFPQIQFKDFEHQEEYVPCMLRSMSHIELELEGGHTVRLLQKLVDRNVYKPFQLLRGPYACKLHRKEVMESSRFEPEGFFDHNELTCFAGYVQPDYALALPSLAEIMEQNKDSLQELGDDEDPTFAKDLSLFNEDFRRHLGGVLDLAGLTQLERYEVLLDHLHEDRADDWKSWWYISGITCHMIQSYVHCEEAQDRAWRAHCRWSSQSWKFDELENWDRVEKAMNAPRLPTLRSLIRLVQNDNPEMQVRENLWTFRLPRPATSATRATL